MNLQEWRVSVRIKIPRLQNLSQSFEMKHRNEKEKIEITPSSWKVNPRKFLLEEKRLENAPL